MQLDNGGNMPPLAVHWYSDPDTLHGIQREEEREKIGMWQVPDLPEEEDMQFGKRIIHRGQEDLQVITTETDMECPHCSCEFAE